MNGSDINRGSPDYDQMSLEQLLDEEDQLSSKIRERIEKDKKTVISDITEKIKKYRISAAELSDALSDADKSLGFVSSPPMSKKTGTVSSSSKKKNRTKSEVLPKYRNLDSQTWSGRGLAPRWMGNRESEEFETNKQLYWISEDGKTKAEKDQGDGLAAT